MCGFVGILNTQPSKPVMVDVLTKMSQAIIHRGPDEAGWLIDGPIGMGSRRLSIIDIDAGHQPFHNENHTVHVVFNGEIYNFEALRTDLINRGHSLTSRVDGEVLPHLYEEYGIEFVHHLRGMFAIALFDDRDNTLYLVRDGFGIKPVYYCETTSEIMFASELKSLLVVGDTTPNISRQSLWDYLTYQYIPDPDTIFEGIHKLPPGCYLRFKNGTTRIKRYFDPTFDVDESMTPAQGREAIYAALKQSVAFHSIADVPVGALLSGGVDSSIIASLLTAHQPQLHTFTVGFEGGHQNEWSEAEALASQLGTTHHAVKVGARDILEHLPRFMHHMDEPIADPSALGLYFVTKHAREHVKVILSGEGADELFGGYPIYHEPLSLEMFKHLPNGLLSLLHNTVHLFPEGMKGRSFIERGTTPLVRRFLGNAKIFSEADKVQIMNGASGMADSFARVQHLYDTTVHQDDITRMQYVDLNTWMPGDILMKADKTSMAHSLELRVPFLDKEVFEVARKIPSRFRITEGTTKWLLREAFRDHLPSAVVHREKLGFATPTAHWIAHSMRDYIASTFYSSLADGVIDKSYARKLLTQHLAGEGDFSRKIWTLFTFLIWYQTFMSSLAEPSCTQSFVAR